MPIVLNNKVVTDITKLKGKPTPTPELYAKREAREALRTKYKITIKNNPSEFYKSMKLIANGKEIPISDSVKFILEHLISGQKQET